MTRPRVAFPLRADPGCAVGDQKGSLAPDLNLQLICPDCRIQPPNLLEEFACGDLLCADCGLVLGDRIVDTRREWRNLSNDVAQEHDPCRIGSAYNPLAEKKQLTTFISQAPDCFEVAEKLIKTQKRVVADKNYSSLKGSCIEIDTMCASISLPSTVCNTAKQLFKRAREERVRFGPSLETVIAACIYIACQQEGAVRTFREICALTKVSKRDVGRCYKALKRKLQTTPAVLTSEELIARYCSNLRLSPSIAIIGTQIVKIASNLSLLDSRCPISIAATSIYFIAYMLDCPRSKKEVANVAGLSEATIKATYKLLYAEREKFTSCLSQHAVFQNRINYEGLPLP